MSNPELEGRPRGKRGALPKQALLEFYPPFQPGDFVIGIHPQTGAEQLHKVASFVPRSRDAGVITADGFAYRYWLKVGDTEVRLIRASDFADTSIAGSDSLWDEALVWFNSRSSYGPKPNRGDSMEKQAKKHAIAREPDERHLSIQAGDLVIAFNDIHEVKSITRNPDGSCLVRTSEGQVLEEPEMRLATVVDICQYSNQRDDLAKEAVRRMASKVTSRAFTEKLIRVRLFKKPEFRAHRMPGPKIRFGRSLN